MQQPQQAYTVLNTDGFGKRYCSETTGEICTCNVGGDDYPRVPEFDLVCTRDHQDGCLSSSKTEVIPSTNSAQGKRARDSQTKQGIKARSKRLNIGKSFSFSGSSSRARRMMLAACTQGVKVAEQLKVAGTLLAKADLSREEKMSEIWKIPSPLLPCKDFITTIMAATPEGGTPIQVTGSELSPGKKWTQEKNAGTLTQAVFNQAQKGRPKGFPNPMADATNYDGTLIILGEHLTFGNQGYSPDHAGFDCPSNDCGPITPFTVVVGQSEGAVNLDGRIYEVQALSGDFGKKGHTVKIWSTLRSPGGGYDRDPIITFTWKKDTAILSGETPTVTVTQTQLPGGTGKVQIGRVSGQYNSKNVPWTVPFIPGSPDSAAALILVPGLKVQNNDSLTLYRDNLPFYAMPSWIEKNKGLLQKNGFDELSWMQLVLWDLSYNYLNAKEFQSLFTDPDEYRAVLQFYMGVDDDDYKMENVVVPVDVEALEKEEEAQEKMDLPYLKKDDKGIEYMEIPWDIVRQIKDESKICEKEECAAGSYLDADGRPKDKSCALCNLFLTPFLATLFWTAKQKGDHKGGLRRRLRIDEFVVPAGNYMYVNTIYTLVNNEEWVQYGTHTVNNEVTYSTPSPHYRQVNIPDGGCWANTIFKLVMYLSKHDEWWKMLARKNNISTFALLNNNIPSNRSANNYVLDPSVQDIACPPNQHQHEAWREMMRGNNTTAILRYFINKPFPNDACWQTEVGPVMRQAPLSWLGMTQFRRGNLGLVGSTNLWDYSAGGLSGVSETDPDANPPLIWDKCCADSCYKPCSKAEERDGCVTGTWPQSFFPRFKFTDVEVATYKSATPTHLLRQIPSYMDRLKNGTVIGASISGDEYFMKQLESIDFSALWTPEGGSKEGTSVYTFNYDLSANQLASMLNPVVDAMECQSYVFEGAAPALEKQFYVSSYKNNQDTPYKTFGPFSVIKITGNNRGKVVVLNSNNLFNFSKSKSKKYFLQEKLDDHVKNIELTSKVPPSSHSVIIVGYKSSGSDAPSPEEPEAVVNQRLQPLPARFSEANKSKVNYFIVDINWSRPMKHSYVLIPMPSVFELTPPDDQSDGVTLDAIKTVFNLVQSKAKKVTPYSVSAFTKLFSVDLDIITDTNAANDGQDLRPSGDTGSGSSGNEPLWPLFLAVALFIALIVLKTKRKHWFFWK